jgi:hypothetical protein
MSRRLHIMVTDGQYDLLNELANEMRTSVSELIRTVIDRQLRPSARPPRNGFLVSLGITRRPNEPIVARRPGIKFVD